MKRGAIILILFSWQTLKSQDLEFSQFFNAPVYLNPAFAGVDAGPRFTLNYRNQWAALDNAFISYAASYDQYIQNLNGGIGALIVSDRQANGLYLTNSLSGMYAYKINLSRKFALQAAAQFSLVQKRISNDQLIFGENINPDDGSIIGSGSADLPDKSSISFPDFGGGFLFYTKKVFFGFSAKHITSPNESLITNQISPLPMRWSANLGFEFYSRSAKRTSVFFTPTFMFVQQARFNQLTGGAVLGVGVFYGGLSYRTSLNNADAVILLSGIQKGVFRFGYSFDATISSLSGSTAGTHEVALVLNFHDSEKIKKKRHTKGYSDCPNIF